VGEVDTVPEPTFQTRLEGVAQFEFRQDHDVAHLVACRERESEKYDDQRSYTAGQSALLKAAGWILMRVSENIPKCEANDSSAFERSSPVGSPT